MEIKIILNKLKSLGNPKNVAGMARFGISSENTFGVPVPALRKLAKEIDKDHDLALKLWRSGIHEAKILASMVDETKLVDEKQMDEWIEKFDSWDVCDQVCMNLFDKIPIAYRKAIEWAKRSNEFEKRAGFALMACLAWHDKTAPDGQFEQFFPSIQKNATDERNFVKKAVNWALRQIGKRNSTLRKATIKIAGQIQKLDSKSARWIGSDALKELKKRKD